MFLIDEHDARRVDDPHCIGGRDPADLVQVLLGPRKDCLFERAEVRPELGLGVAGDDNVVLADACSDADGDRIDPERPASGLIVGHDPGDHRSEKKLGQRPGEFGERFDVAGGQFAVAFEDEVRPTAGGPFGDSRTGRNPAQGTAGDRERS